ncbi:MAG: COG3650 family protein [Sphingomonadaceae bacterium]
MIKHTFLTIASLAMVTTACQSPAESERTTEAFAEIADSETIRFTGTEPFWGGSATGDQLTYTTPENPDGATIVVTRFAGNSGLGLSGKLEDQTFDMVVTAGTCSDGMSDREYPFTVTLEIGEDKRSGCAWTTSRPFTGPENP